MAHSRSPRRRRRPSTRTWIVVGLIAAGILVVSVLAVVGWVVTRGFYAAVATPPAHGTTVIAPEQSKATVALKTMGMDADAVTATEYLAAQPTAYWITPEQDPIGTVGATVTSLIAQARTEKRTLAVVVYGLPERDCGNHSAGGLEEDDYQVWVKEIAAGIATGPDVRTIVILEPDSIALAPDCGDIADRARTLQAAVGSLVAPHTWIYVDGGHSRWRSAAEMADLIRQIGVIDRVRGVALNVSNYQSSYDEFAFAHALSDALGGTHAIIDTSRNGAATAGATWCNPRGQRVGDPGGTFGDEVVDTNLWIKPPGESDGTCNGGPAAGVWWPDVAVELTQDVG